ncbi:hypothetical protein [Granulicoccus sp. GXG6511]|uniref:hypothetical protein n=1 Tax=Granulicoccus sp. GXG6511 TaxID=3381351 RepID=UPI003D7E490F
MSNIRTHTIEPRRAAYAELERRFGEKAGSRYQEAVYRAQPEENFHYRPMWDPSRELYDPDYSVLKLTDPYLYTDPRQFYYASFVAKRAEDYENFAKNLKFIEERNLVERLAEHWKTVIQSLYLPMRHWEGAAQLILINGGRFAWGHSISQVLSLSSFDRLGNAQAHSMIGLTVAGGTTEALDVAKEHWMDSEALQPLRKYTEEALIEKDWGVGLIAVDLIDAQLFPLMHAYVEDMALAEGATVMSLLNEHFTTWYADQQKWLNPLLKAWVNDENHGEQNAQALKDMVETRLGQATAAVQAIAEQFDATLPQKGAVDFLTQNTEALKKRYSDLGIPL